MIIRPEQPPDETAIFELTRAAFTGRPFSAGTEQFIVNALRAANALILSLVADDRGEIVGHVAFSPVTIDGESGDWYGLGPVAVAPDRQSRGIGTALINEGLNRLRVRGAKGCVLLGDPAYYGRFGFANTPGLTLEGVPPHHFHALTFAGDTPQGAVAFHPAFDATD